MQLPRGFRQPMIDVRYPDHSLCKPSPAARVGPYGVEIGPLLACGFIPMR
jgi:hypothetical protein